jgi:hypothetical protein
LIPTSDDVHDILRRLPPEVHELTALLQVAWTSVGATLESFAMKFGMTIGGKILLTDITQWTMHYGDRLVVYDGDTMTESNESLESLELLVKLSERFAKVNA